MIYYYIYHYDNDLMINQLNMQLLPYQHLLQIILLILNLVNSIFLSYLLGCLDFNIYFYKIFLRKCFFINWFKYSNWLMIYIFKYIRSLSTKISKFRSNSFHKCSFYRPFSCLETFLCLF